MHADPEGHSAVVRKAGVACAQDLLDLQCTPERSRRGRELREQVVAGRIDHTAVVPADDTSNLLSILDDRVDGRRLVVGHEPAVSDRISG